jgi:hypothetical protein
LLHNLYPSPYIFWVIKSRRVRWVDSHYKNENSHPVVSMDAHFASTICALVTTHVSSHFYVLRKLQMRPRGVEKIKWFLCYLSTDWGLHMRWEDNWFWIVKWKEAAWGHALLFLRITYDSYNRIQLGLSLSSRDHNQKASKMHINWVAAELMKWMTIMLMYFNSSLYEIRKC